MALADKTERQDVPTRAGLVVHYTTTDCER